GKCLHEQARILALAESVAHLVEVTLEMLRGDMMPASYDAALPEREGVLVRVGVDVPVDGVHLGVAFLVIDPLETLLIGRTDGLHVGREFVGYDELEILRYKPAHRALERDGLEVGNDREPK